MQDDLKKVSIYNIPYEYELFPSLAQCSKFNPNEHTAEPITVFLHQESERVNQEGPVKFPLHVRNVPCLNSFALQSSELGNNRSLKVRLVNVVAC